MDRMRRILALLLALILLLSIAGCAGDDNAAPEDPEGPEDDAPVSGDENEPGGGEGEESPEPETPLSVMRRLNTAEPVPAEGNRRAWYEVFVYSFRDSDGDGIGDLKGITEKLDYINDGDPATDSDLGVEGIWLTPIMPSDTYHKYDVRDYKSIDPDFGTLEDFEALLEACHARGVKVIIDLVMNHTSSAHPWFTAAREYLTALPEGEEPDAAECPYVDYYNFSREMMPGGCALGDTGWYYEAPFWSEMPDLNLRNPQVRAEFEDIVSFWLDLGVDGFRLDAAKEFVSGDVAANVEILTWLTGAVKAISPEAYLVAEVWNDMSTYTQYYASGIDSVFNFAFADTKGIIASALKNNTGSGYGSRIEEFEALASGYSESYIDAPFYTNHDMGRSAGYYPGEDGERQVKMAEAMNLLMSGSAFLYYGEEIGMKGAGKDENKRAPMYWSAGEDPGLCSGPPDMDSVAMTYPPLDEQLGEGGSIYNFVVQTIRLREAHSAISSGKTSFEEELSPEGTCVLRKTSGDEEVLLVFNLTGGEISLDLTGVTVGEGEPKVGGALVTSAEEPKLQGGTLTVPGYSVTLLTK